MSFKTTVREWFKTGLKPTQVQFWSLFDSVWFKDEKIPVADIEGIEDILNAKAEAIVLDNHLGSPDAHVELFNAKENTNKKGTANGYAPLDEFTKILSTYLNMVNDLTTGGTDAVLTAEQGKQLKVQIDGINLLLTSNDVNLDTVQEIVTAIKTVQTSFETILVNDLTTGGTTKALTAEMGKSLKALIDDLVVPKATDTIAGIVKTNVTEADPVVYTAETVDNLLDGKANYFLDIKPITGITYNAIITDVLTELVYDGTLAMNVIIPNNATVPFPIGTSFFTLATNTGILTASGGTGVILKVKSGISLSAIQNEVRQYVKIGVNTWNVRGDLNLGAVTQQELAYLAGTTSNLQAQINSKVTLAGTPNFLMKFLTSATATVSRIFDNGTYLGIGTYKEPTKDLTLGNQEDREIGIEQSDNLTKGRDLKIIAGRTIDFSLSAGFVTKTAPVLFYIFATDPTTGTVYGFQGSGMIYKKELLNSTFIATGYDSPSISESNHGSVVAISPSGNFYICSGGLLLKSIGGLSSFISTGQPASQVTILPSNDIYVIDNTTIKKQIGETGSFISQTAASNFRYTMTSGAGSVYVYNNTTSTIEKQMNGTGAFVSITGVLELITAMAINTNGDLYIVILSNVIKKRIGDSGNFFIVPSEALGGTYKASLAVDNNSNIWYTYNSIIYSVQFNDGVGTPNLDGGTLIQSAGTGKGTGQSRHQIATGQKTASGTDMQVETVRVEVDEIGAMLLLTNHNYADQATAVAAGLRVGSFYWHSDGTVHRVM